MTNEIIQAIREEIARLQPSAPKPGNMKSVDAKVAMQVHARLNKLLSFLSDLEKSLLAKDADDKVLEVEAVSYCFDNGLNISPRVAADFARHFYELGCRRTAEKYDEIEYNRQRAEASGSSEIPKDLEEAVNVYSNCYSNPDGALARAARRAYITGARSMKKHIITLIESRISEIIGDAQPKPALRAELQELIERIKNGL